MLNDLRHAVRVLLQAKGWTSVVVISLALGIGANTALFSAVNGLLLKQLPVHDPDTLVRLRWSGRNQMATSSSDYGFSGTDAAGSNIRATFSYPMFQQLLIDNRTMTDLFACAPWGRVNVVADGQADIANAFIATGNFFRVLGVTAVLGRTLVPEDDQPAAPPAIVISHRYWRSRFGSDPNVIGKSVRVNDVPVTIVGVISPEFTGVQQAVEEPRDVTVPLALDSLINPGEKRLSQPTYWWVQIMGRVKPGVTPAQVQANLEGVFRHTARAGLDSYLGSLSDADRSLSRNRNRTDVPDLRVDSGSRGVYQAGQADLRAVTILSVVVVLVLLIVCANVANLLLSRSTTRRKEISVRLSLGATRTRLIVQLLIESILLASIGGGLGIALGYWGQRLLPGAIGRPTPLDWRVLAFVLVVTVLTGIVFGLAPALRASGVDVNAALKENSRSVVASRSLLGKSLLVAQVTMSLVLLVGAGLFLRTLQNLRQVDVGFNPRNLVLFQINPQLNGYDERRAATLFQEMIDGLQATPGVRGVTFSNMSLLSGGTSTTNIFVRGRTYAPDQRDGIHRLVVAPNFFETMGMPLLLGREPSARDSETAPKVVVINDTAARKYFTNENPIGQRFGTSPETSDQLEIIGVVRDAKYNSVRDAAPPTMYLPHLQTRTMSVAFAVRTGGDPVSATSGIRETVRRIDPNVPLQNVSTQAEQIERRFLQEKVFAQALALFGGLALSLASIGLFGLISYGVARRTNEIGVRMALGAERRAVLGMIMRESMILVAIGVGLGVAIALASGRLVSSILFGVAPTDAATVVVAVTIMAIVAAAAGYLPARRASRVDPMVALRYE